MSNRDATLQQDPSSIPHWYQGDDSEVLSLTDGDGAYVYDDKGNEILDFVSQLYCVNAGHSNQAIIDAITEQAGRIPYVSSSKRNDTRSKLANRLAEIAPGDLSQVYFSISGSEANESAVQIAREYTGASKVLTRWRSYHGSTYGAGSLTGDPSTRNVIERHAATTGAAKFLPPLVYDSPFAGDTPEEIGQNAADHVEFVVREEGPDSIAAILMEPVAGSSGGYTAPPGYWTRLREICDEHDILLIADEVICGFGRCGDWFGVQTEGVEPDLMTFAKGLTSSYVPLAGVLASEEVGAHVRDQGIDVGQTFAGHPMGCAAALAAIDEYEGGLIDNVRRLEPSLQEGLQSLADKYPEVVHVHGRGFLWGIQFADPETGDPLFDPRVDEGDNPLAEIHQTALDHGVMFALGRPAIQLIAAPPLCAGEKEIRHAVDTLDSAIDAVL
jgi:taurine--2-oxoglutarate transaminase